MTKYIKCGGGGLPPQVLSDMEAVLNKKFGTSTTYPSNTWPDLIRTMIPLPEKSAQGSIAHFTDGADTVPLKSSKFYITPQQAAGTPTPINPLPITGWTDFDVTATGKNLFDISTIDSIDTDGNGTMRNGCVFSLSGTFTVSGVQTENAYIYGKIKSGSTYGSVIYFTQGSPTTFSRTLTINQGEELLIYDGSPVATMSASTERLKIINIEVGSSSTTYAPYTATTYPVTLGQTVYGGFVKDGEVWGTHGVVDLSTIEWSLTSNRARTTTLQGLIEIPPSNDTPTTAIAEKYTAIAWSDSLNNHQTSYALASDGTLVFYYDGNNTPTGLFVYPLATPVKLADIDPLEIVSRLGVNNIWCECGDLEVEYRADIELSLNE